MTEALWLLRDFLDSGGWVLWTILFTTILLWTLMLERLWFLSRIFPAEAGRLQADWLARDDRHSLPARCIRHAWLSQAQQRLTRYLPMVRVLIALCPLLGLLGTVTGMVQVFDVMALSGNGNPREMAAGVSRATVPTMAGMVIAISGLFCLARLDQQARRALQMLTDKLHHD
ncbi:MotA/TolQ/ExbB proton channel family protein [Halopseudomonas nanhaiensis]|uniref:MotA/TolQ/ExbB proton channel family protein n=1 Tax=Halopseudomonas nanhaiensis TaxID=2830842 RepID=UPI001CBFCCCE|nr:MotA/TolQ/ExbB proton channel family protein [Halopseudomonas nanhaiensis]